MKRLDELAQPLAKELLKLPLRDAIPILRNLLDRGITDDDLTGLEAAAKRQWLPTT